MEHFEELMALVKSRPEGVTNLVVDSLGFWSWGGARKTRQRKIVTGILWAKESSRTALKQMDSSRAAHLKGIISYRVAARE